MKKILILSLSFLMIGSIAYSQKKPNINKAERLRNSGNLMDAKEILDEVGNHPKTQKDGKSWYYKGLLYFTIDTISDPNEKLPVPGAFETGLAAFKKADELNPNQKKEYFIAELNQLPVTKSQQVEMLWGHYLNKGVDHYKNDELIGAIENFKKCQALSPQDTTAYIFTGFAALQSDDKDLAWSTFRSLEDLDYMSEDMVVSMVYLARTHKEDDELTLEYLEKGLKAYPRNLDLLKIRIDLLIKLGRLEEAKKSITQAISEEKDNEVLHFSLASLYEREENFKKAKEHYQKSVEINPEFFEGNFNLFVVYFNEGKEKYNEANKLDSKEYAKRGKALYKEGEEIIKQGLKYGEKALSISPEDTDLMEYLYGIYLTVDMKDKAKSLKEKLKQRGIDVDAD